MAFVLLGSQDPILPDDARFPVRLGLEIRDETVCFRDLYDLRSWNPECPSSQRLSMPNGFYRITVYTREPASGIVGDSQEIHLHFVPILEKAKLAHTGVPQLC